MSNEKILDISIAIFLPLEEVWFIPTNQESMDILKQYDPFYKGRVEKIEQLASTDSVNDPEAARLSCRLYTFCDLGLRNIIWRDHIYARQDVREDLPVLQILSQEEYHRGNHMFKYTPNNNEAWTVDPDLEKRKLPIFPNEYYKVTQHLKLSLRFERDLGTCVLTKLMYDVLLECIGNGYTIRIRVAQPENNKFVGDYIDSRKAFKSENNMFYPCAEALCNELEEVYNRFFAKEFYVLKECESHVEVEYVEEKVRPTFSILHYTYKYFEIRKADKKRKKKHDKNTNG